MKAIWIGTVELRFKEEPSLEYETAFTNFVTWAESVETFTNKVQTVCTHNGWELLSLERAAPFDPQLSYCEEIEDIVESARDNPDACIHGTFHTYPVN